MRIQTQQIISDRFSATFFEAGSRFSSSDVVGNVHCDGVSERTEPLDVRWADGFASSSEKQQNAPVDPFALGGMTSVS